jgi:signal peptidase I
LRYLRILALALVLAVTLKVFVADAVTVPSRSMEPAILPGDCILLDKTGFAPSFLASRLPSRGDVVAFELPAAAGETGDAGGDRRGALALKRCVAVAGDSVEFRDRTILVNGAVAVTGVDDPGPFFADGAPRRVPRAGDPAGPADDGNPGSTAAGDCIFVIGDNHAVSLDSRAWGFIPARTVVGKAAMVYWSRAGDGGVRWSRIGTLVR